MSRYKDEEEELRRKIDIDKKYGSCGWTIKVEELPNKERAVFGDGRLPYPFSCILSSLTDILFNLVADISDLPFFTDMKKETPLSEFYYEKVYLPVLHLRRKPNDNLFYRQLMSIRKKDWDALCSRSPQAQKVRENLRKLYSA